MWTCTKCREEIEDGFDVCWNCGTDMEGNVDAEFETADAPTNKPLAVESWDAERLQSSPLTISSVNYGAGAIATPLIIALLLGALLVGICTVVSVEPPAFRPVLLFVLAGGVLFGLMRFVWAIATVVLHVELSDRIVVRRLLRVSEYGISEIVAVEFEKELKAGLTSMGLRRLVTFVLADGQRIRVHIDESVESRLRVLIESTDIASRAAQQ
jgi:hypothetical protein